MGCEIEYVDPLDPEPKSKERVTEVPGTGNNTFAPPRRKVSAPRIFPLKDRASSACPSAQECVGQRGGSITGERGSAGILGNEGGNLVGRSPLVTLNRSWKDVLTGNNKPPGSFMGTITPKGKQGVLKGILKG